MGFVSDLKKGAKRTVSNPFGTVVGAVDAITGGEITKAAPILDVSKWGEKLDASFMKATKTPKPGEEAFAPEQYQSETDRLAAAQAARMGAGAPGADVRTQQMGLASALQAQAQGTAPSVAEAQMKQAMERSIAGQQASLAGARGVDPGLAMRMMARQGAAQRAELGQAAGIARLQEQQGAQQQLAGVLSGTRGADVQTQALNDAAAQFFEAQRTGNFQAMTLAKQKLEELKLGAKTASQGQKLGVLSGFAQAGAQAAGAGA